MNTSSPIDRRRSPRAAMVANLALLVSGAVLAMVNVVDHVTAAVLVEIGVAGVVVSLLGQR